MLGRRDVIAGVGAVTAAGLGSGAATTAPSVSFTHGVASGDPLLTAVVIWTRAVPATPGMAQVAWEMSDTEKFAAIIRSGTATTDETRDYTVKVDVTGLTPGRIYFYRFTAGAVSSPIGRTRTFPNAGKAPLKLAAMCCANVGQGFFNVYRHCADRDDIDVVLFVGDYIYEYGTSDYSAEENAKGYRTALPRHKIVNLADYRLRYGSYRADPDLQEIHRRHPFIAVWDDHEIANNAFKDGSENHWPNEGPWKQRKASAIKAYFEWMPIRPLDPDPTGRIYRSFDVGDVASIIMLDTRLYGREKAPGDANMIFMTEAREDGSPGLPIPFDARPYPPQAHPELAAEVGGDADKLPADHIFMPDFARYKAEVLNAERSILGAEQEAWLSKTLTASKQRGMPWQILGQQTITATFMPVDPAPHMDPAKAGGFRADFFRRMRIQEQNDMPFASDTWGGGYPRSRDRMVETLRSEANNTIILSGDLHNAWGFVHNDKMGALRAFEVTTPSVTSPGMESFMGTQPSYAQAMMAKNKNLIYAELTSRGYAVLAISPEAVDVQWTFVDTVRSKKFTAKVDRHFKVMARSATAPMRVVDA